VEVHHRQDRGGVAFDGEEDAERETRKDGTADRGPRQWELECAFFNSSENALDGGKEGRTKARSLALVPKRSLEHV
jgi:hypothetical protein